MFTLPVCFNTLPFFVLQEELHPIGRPFALCFKCRARSSLPHVTLRGQRLSTNSASRFLQASEYARARSNFSRINFSVSSLVSVCCCINSACFCFLVFVSVSIIILLGKQKTPGCLILGSLECCMCTVTLRSSGTPG